MTISQNGEEKLRGGKEKEEETLLNDHNCDVHTQVASPFNLCDK